MIAAYPRTGRTHQIRRHLKHISHPIIGDAKYGKGIHNRIFEEKQGIHRLLLAATEMVLTHPATSEKLRLTAPLQADFASVVTQMDWASKIPEEWLP